MALDARRRQKKAEKRKAKERAKHKELVRRKTEDMGQRLAKVAAAPVLHCCTTQDLWDKGMSQVLVSRELNNGQVAFAIFLVDRFCLGVKDAFCAFVPRSNYVEQIYEPISQSGDVVTLSPAEARKLVEGAVAYAHGIGLSAHGDYARARHIFGAIDPAGSGRTFEYGKDGKPFFMSGPHDSPGRCASIIGILTEHCGKGGFDYMVGMSGSALTGAGLEWDEFADEESGDFEGGGSDDVIDEAPASESAPTLPIRMAAGIRRMLFGDE